MHARRAKDWRDDWQQVKRAPQLVHLSSTVLFCACALKQGPRMSAETDIQQVSEWQFQS